MINQVKNNISDDDSRSGSYYKDGIFIVLPLTFWKKNGEVFIESQAIHGLDQWAENFSWVTVAAPVSESYEAPVSSWKWLPISQLKHKQRIEFIELPQTYNFLQFVPVYRKMRKKLAQQIRRHRYLQFAIGGLIGDWGAVAGLEASEQQRKFAVWADRIEHQVIARSSNERFDQKLANLIKLPLMKQLEKHIVRRSAVGLFNGNETFQYYRHFAKAAYKVHDIHVKETHYIGSSELTSKLKRMASGEPLKICYSGRANAMKAPLDWIEVLFSLDQLGVSYTAQWLGDGELLDTMKGVVKNSVVKNTVHLPGFMADHDEVMATIRDSDIFLFTHITPESPRCLIEALIAGTVIVGYHSLYSEDLIDGFGGGELAPIKAINELSRLIEQLDQDRTRLSVLTREAAENGRRFNHRAAFKMRSDLVKQRAGS